MEPFKYLSGVAAPLPMVNVDTDMIIPKQFLKTIKRTGLGNAKAMDARCEGGGRRLFRQAGGEIAERRLAARAADDDGCRAADHGSSGKDGVRRSGGILGAHGRVAR